MTQPIIQPPTARNGIVESNKNNLLFALNSIKKVGNRMGKLTLETKKEVIRLIYKRFHEQLNITGNDIEITIFETPKNNWGIRGLPADELILNYTINH